HPPKWTGYQLLALIFGTLLSSQGTDASFVLTLSGFPPGFRSVLAFPTLSESFALRFPGSSLSRFPFPAIPTLPDHFRAVSGWDLNSVTVGGSVPFGAPLR
ncbi:hypothetical protein ACFXPI_25025, partial [Streptomyces sp. NPDC059104]|uniref:hypothetical protein n=1 Tax=Streptomyces sp. NPDC059104 TaxID=3346729 RepID=UPI0036A0B16F